MTSDTTTRCLPQSEIETTEQLFDNWFEAKLRDRTRDFLQAMLEARARRDAGALPLRPAGEVDERRIGGTRGDRSSSRPPPPHTAGDIRQGDGGDATRPAGYGRRQDDRVEEPSVARLSAPYARCRRADRQLLPGGHQHAPGAPRAGKPVRWRSEQGHSEPGTPRYRRRLRAAGFQSGLCRLRVSN
jgi:hypothetical protein